MSWVDEYRSALEASGAVPVELDDDHVTAVLALARDVAHGTERRFAPLATFLAGQFVAGRTAAGQSHAAALHDALTVARRLLPEAEDGQ